MTPVTRARASPRLQGIGFALSGFTMWVVADTAIKLAGESGLPPYEIMALQGLLTAIVLASYHLIRGDLRLLWPVRPVRQMIRALLDTGNVLCVIIALHHLPLDFFYILVFSAPMVIAAMAWGFLKEPLRMPEAIAILIGFMGVIVAVRPSSPHAAGNWVGYMACAVAVICFSSSIVWSRRMTQSERLDSMIFTSASIMALTGVIAMLWHVQPLSSRSMVLLPLISATVGLGNLFSFKALRSISAASLSQYHYSQLISGALLAWLIWHEAPTMPMIIGAFLIIGSGLYVASRSEPTLKE